jgi:hypothetical protein
MAEGNVTLMSSDKESFDVPVEVAKCVVLFCHLAVS